MKRVSDLILKELYKLIHKKSINDIIDFEFDNIYNKSAVSKIIKSYISKNCFYNLNIIEEHNIKLKFISVNEDYKSYEAMSFTNTSLYDIIFEKWDTNDEFELATLKNQLNYNFLFIPVIKIKRKGIFNHCLDWKIGDFSYWTPTKEELIEIGKEWMITKELLKKGIKVTKVKFGKSFRNSNNLPKQSKTKYIHLRPHGINSYDYDLKYLEYSNGETQITKQSFWLNKKFINTLLKNNKWKMISKEE